MDGLRKLDIYAMEFYSAVKKNGTLLLTGKWMEVKTIVLSKVSQVQKYKDCMFWSKYKYQCYYIFFIYMYYIYIYAEHVSKSGTIREH
jgi:hypothetical protein